MHLLDQMFQKLERSIASERRHSARFADTSSDSPKLDVATLGASYGVSRKAGEAPVDPFKLFFAIHTYYATFIKLLAV
jgi:hypothetical protein